ncbi:PTS system cellobiose-specific IIA component [Spiroplasma chinense]|uniref:PTS system cellobiose-specific IIA component n=1 Tax=Spiroplasma chinense TaxID=216932 RepID=A0A5B9Y4E3_9MOLU|nr:PTS lactose/cellobiose transporter subunit IIA [Spiroplasma chinense]QEH61546.1 PTS system cellobiose-specific IIA component [Spiroplasma chinense]
MEIDWQDISMQIITHSGTAKTNAVMAIRSAKEFNFSKAEELIESAETEMNKAHNAHMDIVVHEAQGNDLEYKLLFVHAEDQLLNTQTIILLAKEMIEMYKIIEKK